MISDEILKTIQIGVTALFVGPIWQIIELNMCSPYYARKRGELSNLENEVIGSMQRHELISRNTESDFDQNWTFGEKLADKIASFGGSWAFLICFALFLTGWIVLNTVVMVVRPVDPYPFILLNLVLSCLAAIQAPIIMMSQNRQEAKDRLRSQHDYQINLKPSLRFVIYMKNGPSFIASVGKTCTYSRNSARSLAEMNKTIKIFRVSRGT